MQLSRRQRACRGQGRHTHTHTLKVHSYLHFILQVHLCVCMYINQNTCTVNIYICAHIKWREFSICSKWAGAECHPPRKQGRQNMVVVKTKITKKKKNTTKTHSINLRLCDLWLFLARLHSVCVHACSQVYRSMHVCACLFVCVCVCSAWTSSPKIPWRPQPKHSRFHNSSRKTSKVVTSVTSPYLWCVCGVKSPDIISVILSLRLYC